jgi:hypothetical protein
MNELVCITGRTLTKTCANPPQRVGYGLDVPGAVVQLPEGAKNVSVLENITTGSAPDPISYSVDSGAFPWSRTMGVSK